MTANTGPSEHRLRKIRFHDRVQFKTIRHVSEFSEDEISNGWYDKEDFSRMSDDVSEIASLIHKGETIRNGEELCIRGLEHIVEDELADYRAEKMIHSIDAVLDEQEEQWDEGRDDPKVIAEIYSEFSTPLLREAHLIGLKDAEEGYKTWKEELMEDPQYRQPPPTTRTLTSAARVESLPPPPPPTITPPITPVSESQTVSTIETSPAIKVITVETAQSPEEPATTPELENVPSPETKKKKKKDKKKEKKEKSSKKTKKKSKKRPDTSQKSSDVESKSTKHSTTPPTSYSDHSSGELSESVSSLEVSLSSTAFPSSLHLSRSTNNNSSCSSLQSSLHCSNRFSQQAKDEVIPTATGRDPKRVTESISNGNSARHPPRTTSSQEAKPAISGLSSPSKQQNKNVFNITISPSIRHKKKTSMSQKKKPMISLISSPLEEKKKPTTSLVSSPSQRKKKTISSVSSPSQPKMKSTISLISSRSPSKQKTKPAAPPVSSLSQQSKKRIALVSSPSQRNTKVITMTASPSHRSKKSISVNSSPSQRSKKSMAIVASPAQQNKKNVSIMASPSPRAKVNTMKLKGSIHSPKLKLNERKSVTLKTPTNKQMKQRRKRSYFDRKYGTELSPFVFRRDGTVQFRKPDIEKMRREQKEKRKNYISKSMANLLVTADDEDDILTGILTRRSSHR